VSLYVPLGNSGKVYVPVPLEVVSKEAPLEFSTTMTFAPAMAEPELSVTVPVRRDRVCVRHLGTLSRK
jgi:hypothetical protein